ncbi:DHA2 family efflux MFS transporter permease subunit [Bailinhaonella thermotolerans]|uniref:DHA2 family efflux MFS transporter permease subunit n=1 Tax=Bailinhaonella thermotolerans TaxID=1070861 RepID=A0A3A4API0_9ACTN|nr:DHA2 family efflux MFS transporter permease subunit [Bailinhaonella thermotolerans]RJL30941.1 DHA2 family efflux MFS transporter permease subunit [Bailinhaonella thermotolerans]
MGAQGTTPVRVAPALTVVGVAGFVTTLDNTVVTVALPTIQRDLGASLAGLEWVMTAYILVFSGLMLAGGRLADVFGRRRVLQIGLGIFTGASLLSGLAGNQELLIAARAVQGAGAALVIPTLLAIIAMLGGERARSAGVAVWMTASAAALALGPVTGGLIAQHWDWSWIFLINVPLGIATMAGAAFAVPESRDPRAARIDLPGLATSGIALVAGTFALIHGRDLGWGSPVIVGALLVTVLGAAGFVAVESSVRAPMIDMALFRAPAFSGGVVAQVLWGLGVNGVFFFTALFLQGVLGFSPTLSGLAFLPLAAMVVLVTPFAPKVSERYGAARTVAAGLALVAGGMVAVAFLRPGDGFADLIPAVTAIGVGSGLTMPLGSAVLGAIPPERAGVAGGIFSVSREVSGVFGIAAIGVVVTSLQEAARAEGAAHADAFMRGYSVGLVAAAALVLLGAVVSLLTLPGRTPGAVALPETRGA